MSGRWEQFDNLTSLRDAMGRLFDQSFTFGGRAKARKGHRAAFRPCR